MDIKRYIKNIILILTIGVLFPQNLELFTQKITLENSLKDKIYSELERSLDKNKDRFVVIVNLELGRYGDLLNNKAKNNSNTNNRGMEYLPGVPLSGSKGSSNNDKQSVNRRISSNDYIISEIDIEVWIEPSLANGANEKMIESLIKGIIPQTSQCDDCVTIETMNFNNMNNEDSEIAKLRKELDDLKAQARQDQMTELNLKLADLQAQLQDSEDERLSWEEHQMKQDSLRLVYLEEEWETGNQTAKDQRDEYLNKYIETLQSGAGTTGSLEGGKSSDDNKSLLIFILIPICLLGFGLLIYFIKKKSVVYLKPKGPENNNSNNSTKNNNEDKSSDTKTSVGPQSVYPGSTSANIDESVLSSELKALRQSSIAMSASQKEGATQIIKDWMGDGNQSDTEGGE